MVMEKKTSEQLQYVTCQFEKGTECQVAPGTVIHTQEVREMCPGGVVVVRGGIQPDI